MKNWLLASQNPQKKIETEAFLTKREREQQRTATKKDPTHRHRCAGAKTTRELQKSTCTATKEGETGREKGRMRAVASMLGGHWHEQ